MRHKEPDESFQATEVLVIAEARTRPPSRLVAAVFAVTVEVRVLPLVVALTVVVAAPCR